MAASLHTSNPALVGGVMVAAVALASGAEPLRPAALGIASAGGALLIWGHRRAVAFAHPRTTESYAAALIGAAALAVAAIAWHRSHHGTASLVAAVALGGLTLAQTTVHLRLREWREPKRLARFHENVQALAANGNLVALAREGRVFLWESGVRRLAWDAHVFDTFALAFSPGGRVLATGGWDHDPPWPEGEQDTFAVKLWDTNDGGLVARLSGHTGNVVTLSYSPDRPLLASGSVDAKVRLWSTQSNEALHTLAAHRDPVHSVAFGPSGVLVSACGRQIRVWNADTAMEIRVVDWPSTCVALSHDGRLIAAGDQNGAVTTFDAATGQRIATSPRIKGFVSALTFVPDGALILGGALTGTVYAWDPGSGRVRHRLFTRHWTRLNALAVGEGSALVSAAQDGVVARPFN